MFLVLFLFSELLKIIKHLFLLFLRIYCINVLKEKLLIFSNVA